MVGWPAKGSSCVVVKVSRKRNVKDVSAAVVSFEISVWEPDLRNSGGTSLRKTVSEKLNSRAMACLVDCGMGWVRWIMASWLPRKGSGVKTSRVVKERGRGIVGCFFVDKGNR